MEEGTAPLVAHKFADPVLNPLQQIINHNYVKGTSECRRSPHKYLPMVDMGN